jgi:DNA repair protein RecN (Recombination protein N)
MLTLLTIKNFTIIDNLKIEFQPGMTVLTGETGAGKSIIIDTLELVLGARTDNKIIRQNCERSEISAIFDLQNNPTAISWLEDHEFETNEECIIRRTITSDSRSRSTINGIPCPQQLTRELGSLLLNIHGQHEHQSLTKPTKQLELLDNFAKHKTLCNKVKQNYLSLKAAQIKLTELKKLTENHDAQTELLNYQIQELDTLALAENELEELHQEHKQLSNAEQLLQNCNSALNIIAENQLQTAQTKLTDMNY